MRAAPSSWFAAIGEANSPAERLARIAAFADSFPAKDESLVLAARLVAPELLRVAPRIARRTTVITNPQARLPRVKLV